MSIAKTASAIGISEQETIKSLEKVKDSVLYSDANGVQVRNYAGILEKYYHYAQTVISDPWVNQSANIPFDKENRVYFLLYFDKVMYVGQSFHLSARISTHVNSNKIFNTVSWIDVGDDDIDIVEKFNISHHQAEFNQEYFSKGDLLTIVANDVDYY